MHRLAKEIESLQLRLAWRQRLAAACWIVATVTAVAVALGLIDYVVRYSDPGLRIMATAALVAAALWAVYRWWYVPGQRRLVPLTVARQVESHFPQLNDSLASALEFLQQSEEDETAGSAQLRRHVVAEVETAIEGLPLDEVIDRRPLRRAAAWLAVVGVVFMICLIVDAAGVKTVLARLAAPLGSTEWPRQHHLAFRNVPTRLAVGQAFEVELFDKAGTLPDEVRIEYRTAERGRREESSEPMKQSGDVMVARRENVRGSFAFRAVGGDDTTMPWHWVEVVAPPQLESLSLTVHPPAYTGLEPIDAERHLQVLAGSGIELHGTANKPLSAARILLDGAEPIAASVGDDPAGRRQAFRVTPDRWIAAKSGSYELELADTEGVAGVVGRWNIRVEPDSPPSIAWQRPSGDLYVVPTATVPIELIVKDNLVVARVDLLYEHSDQSNSEPQGQPTKGRVELYQRGAPPVPLAPPSTTGDRGESFLVEHTWDLAALKLPVGTELKVEVEATDFRSGVGRTIGPRRINIITDDELEKRFADQQALIVRQLERALVIERATREGVERLVIQHRDAGTLAGGDRNALQTAELNQRRVGRMLTDPVEGVPALCEAILADIEMNHVANSELSQTIDRLLAELKRLAEGPLRTGEHELTAARKTVESMAQAGDNTRDATVLQSSLSSAGSAQDEVIAALERLITELSGKADYNRFARQLSELREDQLAHQQATRAEIGVETLPLRVTEISRAQRAELNKAAAGQEALAGRFEKTERGMDALSKELGSDGADQSSRLGEAVELARRLAIASKMQETARDLKENRVSGALAREAQIADDIEQVLNVLRHQSERQPERVVESLREAERRLAALRKQLAELREKISQTERQPAGATDPRQLDQLARQQHALQQDINRLAQQLERLQAEEASKSAQNAASRLASSQPNSDQAPTENPKKPASSSEVQQAEQNLNEAAHQLAQRRQQAEDDLALEFVRRFQRELTEIVERQRQVLDATVQLDHGRQPNGTLPEKDVQAIAKLAEEERALAQMTKEHGELLFGLGAVRVSLEDAERRLTRAANLLDARDTSSTTQRAEQRALSRLEGMLDAFSQTANDAAQNQVAPPNAGNGNQQQQPQRRPTFELLEVKMLRMLQVDLNERTREYRQSLSQINTPLTEAQRAQFEREAQELAAEQGQLAELVQNMLTRDNKEREE